ncbi:MAG TPA: hypothetical protein VGF59_27120 [Bryobacteraceae bacterium]|jgi:hypothetical protein
MRGPDPRLHKILRRLILRSFPRLHHHPIDISWGLNDGLLDYQTGDGTALIRVNTCLKGAPDRVLEGGLVHELEHADADRRLGRLRREADWRHYEACRWARIREERAVEADAIRMGYGPQLLAFVRYARRLGYSFSREDGLTEPEIRRAMATPWTSRATGARLFSERLMKNWMS